MQHCCLRRFKDPVLENPAKGIIPLETGYQHHFCKEHDPNPILISSGEMSFDKAAADSDDMSVAYYAIVRRMRR